MSTTVNYLQLTYYSLPTVDNVNFAAVRVGKVPADRKYMQSANSDMCLETVLEAYTMYSIIYRNFTRHTKKQLKVCCH